MDLMLTTAVAGPAAGPLGRLPGLSIVLPCHDEADNIERAIDEATRAAQRVADAHELLVVDDGSRDATRALAAERASHDSRIRVLVHRRNRGYGAALRTGFAAARMEWVFVTDADLQFDLDDLDCVLALAPACDVVAGFRLQRADRAHRRLNAAAWNALVRRSFDLPVRDVDCAFKLIRRDLLQGLDLTADGAMVSTELLVRARAAGAEIAELGVTHRPRVAGRSSGANPAVVLRAFRELRALREEVRADAEPAVRPATRVRAV
ncbi:MAG TPA: glycosyltransferase family 2 protein [Baekduia sp.]|uniref:glycosyltransferase family 2 protein n=1 Tax=Baekduia sp. TaxID=2600305 RepID=UPI002B787C80|nr:glycosyltransferase family 2 protein [Baekduia sp.]HMJ35882.1 glycosyltransferase family 2 protein [Baekduia sp.]